MSKKSAFHIGVFLLIALFLLSGTVAAGEKIEDKLSRFIKAKLNLDTEVYEVIETEYQGEKIVLLAIFGNDKALNSSLGSDIKSGLREHKGQSPVVVSVLTQNPDASFQPDALRVIQNGQTSRANRIIGLTEGFKEGEMPEKISLKGEDEVFWGSKGIITLGSSFDPTTPFKINYGTSSAGFVMGSSRQEEPGSASVSEKETQTSVSEKETQKEGFKGSNDIEEKEQSSPPASRGGSKSGQGIALLAQFGTLLAITLSFL